MIQHNFTLRRLGSSLGAKNSQLPGHAFAVLLLAVGAGAFVGCGTDDEGNGEMGPVDMDMGALEGEQPDPMEMDMEGMQMPSTEDMDMDPAPETTPGGPTPNGLEVPEDFRDWRVIGVADPSGDPNTIHVIVGNDTAVLAARTGNTDPWPDGSMIARYVWADAEHETSADTTAPGDFQALTLMVKDAEAYEDDGGWAYGVWAGPELRPPAAADFDRECVACHTENVADNDYVFTEPGAMPDLLALAFAEPQPNELTLPGDILDWRVIGVANRGDDSTIRVIIGNDEAVDAARAGSVDTWPEGSMIAHFVWAYGENPNVPGAVTPGDFGALTLMAKDSEQYAADGGWAYGVWSTPELAPAEDPAFDRDCVDCHTENVSDRDYVFTVPGALP